MVAFSKISSILFPLLRFWGYRAGKGLIVCLFVIVSVTPARSQDYSDNGSLPISSLADTFYMSLGRALFWFDPGPQSHMLRLKLRSLLKERCALQGLDEEKYLSVLGDSIQASPGALSSVSLSVIDRSFTVAALMYFRDLYQGDSETRGLGSDELSEKYSARDQKHLIHMLAGAKSALLLEKAVDSLEPSTIAYSLLKHELEKQIVLDDSDKIKAVSASLNLYRWLYHFNFKKYIVVNIPSAELYYYEDDTLCLSMKVVVGKLSTKTPRFATYCDQVVLFPYWNVPRSIAVKEILPLCKKDISILDEMKMQVINGNGEIVDPRKLDWNRFTRGNFPYRFRQSTGCDNSLGLIKFNLTSPYSVYLHDTNAKRVFGSEQRYLSHGCIRIEKPIELATRLLGEKLDETLLKNAQGQMPIIKPIRQPVPVFVLYRTADISPDNTVHYYPDVYKLL